MLHYRPRMATTGTSPSASASHIWYERIHARGRGERSRPRNDGGDFGAGLRWGLGLSLPVWFTLVYVVLH